MATVIVIGSAIVLLVGGLALIARRDARPWSDAEYERQRDGGTALGNAFLATQAILDGGGAQHTLEQRTVEQADDVGAEGPPDSGSPR
jgi:hypothetical protein